MQILIAGIFGDFLPIWFQSVLRITSSSLLPVVLDRNMVIVKSLSRFGLEDLAEAG
jgi:hypothetical protein